MVLVRPAEKLNAKSEVVLAGIEEGQAGPSLVEDKVDMFVKKMKLELQELKEVVFLNGKIHRQPDCACGLAHG